MDAKMITGAELRSTVQRWSNHAAAGADSWERCEWKQFTDTMFDQVAEYLNTNEETACAMSYKELIETPLWPEDTRTTPVANIKKEAESPGPRDVRPITALHCAWSSTRYREAWGGRSESGCTRRCMVEYQEPEYRTPSGLSC